MRITAVVLNFRRAADTIRCVQSVRADEPSLEVLVVDNASGDGSAERISEALPETTVLRSGGNLGYAGGNNVGIRRALDDGADAVLILNNDLVLEPGCIAALTQTLAADPVCGIASPLSLLPGPEDIVDFFTGRILLDHAALLAPGRDQPWHGRVEGHRDTEYATGSAMLVRRDVFDKAGLFDEQFFLVWEDVDFSLRARAEGHRLIAVAEGRVRHERSATFGRQDSPLQRYFFVRNPFLLLRKHLSPPTRWAAEARAVRRFRAWSHGDDAAVNRAIRLGLRHGLRGRFGPPPASLLP